MTEKIMIQAKDTVEGKVNSLDHSFGKGLIIDSGEKKSSIVYLFTVSKNADYEVWFRYATNEKRPISIYIDGVLFLKDYILPLTGGFSKSDLKWNLSGITVLNVGCHSLRIESDFMIPHFEKYLFQKTAIKVTDFSQFTSFVFDKPSIKSKNKKHTNYSQTILNYKKIIGIMSGKLGFCGPNFVQIDLTNDCNNNCIGCWCNSPLLGDKAMSLAEKERCLPLDLVKELLDHLAFLNVKEIYLAGGGEPFSYPYIMEVVRYIKQKGFICYINTNFTQVTKKNAQELIDLAVDHLTVSVWAGTAPTYVATHPNKTLADFIALQEVLTFLNKRKNKKPLVKVYHVISKVNYFELDEMVSFARDTQSESLEFTMIDTIPGKTDCLLLSKDQNVELQTLCQFVTQKLQERKYGDCIKVFNFDQFKRRVHEFAGLKGQYDKTLIKAIKSCIVGWDFSRIIADGNMNGCLKSHRIPIGNLYRDSFINLWNSKKQQYFRKKTKEFNLKDPFFRKIGNDKNAEVGCYKSCDNLGRMLDMIELIELLPLWKKSVLKVLAYFMPVLYLLRLSAKRLYVKLYSSFISLQKRRDLSIASSRIAIDGPETAIVDLTNKCVNNCLPCWMHSSDAKETDLLIKQYEIKKEVLYQFFNDCKKMNVKKIRLTGGGEPFLYPHIIAVVKKIKTLGLIPQITTSLLGYETSIIKKVVQAGASDISISLWSASLRSFQKLYPIKTENDYVRYYYNLKKIREVLGACSLTASIMINSVNVLEIYQLYEIAKNILHCDAIYFTLVDVSNCQTKDLLLDQRQVKYCSLIFKTIEEDAKSHSITIHGKEVFEKRLMSSGVTVGEYDKILVNESPCYAGWLFTRILANGDVVPCCRSVHNVVGNIYKNSFQKIWNSALQREFRANAKFSSKDRPYFKNVKCGTLCDHLAENKECHKQIQSISVQQCLKNEEYARLLHCEK